MGKSSARPGAPGPGWLCANSLATQCRVPVGLMRSRLARWARQGRVLCCRAGGVTWYPRYGFTRAGQPVAVIHALWRPLQVRGVTCAVLIDWLAQRATGRGNVPRSALLVRAPAVVWHDFMRSALVMR